MDGDVGKCVGVWRSVGGGEGRCGEVREMWREMGKNG